MEASLRRLAIDMWYRVLVLSACVLFQSALPAQLQAQQDAAASISGTVLDSHGSAVPNATVVVKNQTTGVLGKVNADGAGHFAITGVAAGHYTLTIDAPGFAEATKTDVEASTQSRDISLTLSVGAVEENVEVQAIAGNSIAGQHALSQGSLDTEWPLIRDQR